MANSLETDISSAVAKAKLGLTEIACEKLPNKTGKEINEIVDREIHDFLRFLDIMVLYEKSLHTGEPVKLTIGVDVDKDFANYLQNLDKLSKFIAKEKMVLK